MIFNRICMSHIVIRSYREIGNSANMSPIDAFDVFESYEVFVVSIRASYALVLSIYIGSVTGGKCTLKRSGRIWWVFAWPLLYSMYSNN